MSDYAFFLLLGSAAGAIIAAFGLGLLITHEGSGVVNFAYGAMATWSGYVYADLRQGAYPFPIPGLPARYHFGDDVGFRWAMLLSLLTAVILGLVAFFAVFRPLLRAPALAKVVASIGLVIVFISLIEQRFPDNSSLRVNAILPREPVTFADGVTVPRDGLWLAGIVLLIAAVVWGFSRFTRWGLAIRAAAENEKGAVLLGYSPVVLAAGSFVVASVIGGLIVILASPMIQLSSTVFTFAFLVPALGAALIGRFRYIWPVVFTGLAIGLVQSSFTKMQVDFSWFPQYGAREGLPFLVIIIAMVVMGEGLPDRGSVDTWKLPAVPVAKVTALNVSVPVVIAVGGLMVLGPLWRGAIMTTVVAMVLALSLVVLTGFGGQTSLAQMAFAGVGGFALSKIAMNWGVPFPIAPLLAATIAMGFGVVVGLPALRVRGTNLAIITLAGGVAINEFVFKNPKYVGDASTGGAQVPNPKLGNWDLGLILGDQASRPIFGAVLVVVAVGVALAVANLRRSGSGRRMIATRSNERAAAALGISVFRTKIQVFAVSSFVAGLAGCMIAYRFGSVSDASFGTIASLTALAVAYLGGITCVSGAVTAGITATSGVAFYGISQATGSLGQWEALIGGVLLILTAILNPEGIAGGIRAKAAESRAAKAQSKNGATSSAAAPAH
ncbi:MAG: ABC transporter permease [Ilumatobacter sp.]|nr:ABC transporter permease [Ilumatobacter sp.]MDG2040273.1 ABC transporter permease [Ilumatobacter sp.]NKB40051.1 ABC transporter [Ilumatobacter sp.]